jgi:NAD(P)-dependent dehydrogenase (short-subunit alcohol dehydrogenase family)
MATRSVGRFEGKVAVVTGGNSGIGLAAARGLVEEGAEVVLFGRDRGTLDEAVRSLARTLSAELVGRGVRVNAVSPGPIETPIFGRMGMSADATRETKAGIAAQVPLGRMGTAEEAAAAVLWLASDESSYVVGAELFVDGGLAQI